MWASGVAVAATATTNVLLLALLGAVVLLTVSVHQPEGARGFGVYLAVAGAVVVVRVLAHVVLATPGVQVLVDLPAFDVGPLTLLGPVTREALLAGTAGGLQLAVLILAVGAAHTIADAAGLLRHAPAALGPIATAAVIAVSTFPSLVRSVLDTRDALRLRGVTLTGRGARDRHLLERVVVPVLSGAVERSFAIATGMEARGFGTTDAVRRGAAPLTVAAVGAAGAALLAVLDPAWPRWSAPALALLAGVLTWLALRGGAEGRRTTLYRPPRWTPVSLGLVACGTVGAVVVATASVAVRVPTPDAWLALSGGVLVAVVVAAVPAFVGLVLPEGVAAPRALATAGVAR
nr:energy-coupling factor transporter transmembrane component T [Sanguibacter hominis]